MSSTLLTAADVGALFHCSPEWVQDLARAGRLVGDKSGPRHTWVFTEQAVRDFREAQRRALEERRGLPHQPPAPHVLCPECGDPACTIYATDRRCSKCGKSDKRVTVALIGRRYLCWGCVNDIGAGEQAEHGGRRCLEAEEAGKRQRRTA